MEEDAIKKEKKSTKELSRLISTDVEHKHWRTRASLDIQEQSLCGSCEDESAFSGGLHNDESKKKKKTSPLSHEDRYFSTSES